MLLILAVDHFLDMGRSATNVVGNAVAGAVVARWEAGSLEAREAPRSSRRTRPESGRRPQHMATGLTLTYRRDRTAAGRRPDRYSGPPRGRADIVDAAKPSRRSERQVDGIEMADDGSPAWPLARRRGDDNLRHFGGDSGGSL